MGLHEITDNGLEHYEFIPVKDEKDIEDFIETHPQVIDKNLIILGRQVITDTQKRVDILGLDNNGNVVIIELKKDKTPRDVVSQILEYGVWATNLTTYDLNKIATKHKTLDNFTSVSEKLETISGEFPELNENQRWYIVAETIDPTTTKIASYLSDKGIDINCIEFQFHEKNGKKIVHTDMIVGDNEDISSLDEGEEVDWNYYKEKLGWKDDQITTIRQITEKFTEFAKSKNWDPKVVLNKRYVALQDTNRRRNYFTLKIKNRKLRLDIRIKENIKEFEPILEWEWNDMRKLWRVNLGLDEFPDISIFEKVFEKIREK